MHQNIHTLPKRLNSEQNFTQGTESEDAEMEKVHKQKRAKLRKHCEVTVLGLETLENRAEQDRLGSLAYSAMIGNHLNQ